MQKLRDRFVKLLIFLRVADDHDRAVSLSNVLMIVLIAKVVMMHAQGLALPDVGALCLALAARAHKKHVGAQINSNEADIQTAIDKAGKALEMTGLLETKTNQMSDRLQVLDNRTKTPMQRLQG